MKETFFSPCSHGFVRAAVGIPEVRVADPWFNTLASKELLKKADAKHCAMIVFPELGVSGYSLDDLFQQEALLKSVKKHLLDLKDFTKNFSCLVIVGVPLRIDGRLFNCAAVLHLGKILGIVPKTFLPNYREFYEKRQFCSGATLGAKEVELGGEQIPVGRDLIFHDRTREGFTICVEICEDVWAPIPPSTFGALNGATILVNLSASNVTVGKAEYRRLLGASQSARCISAYIYSASGRGESTTDLAWDGHGMIWENGRLLTEAKRFSMKEQLIFSDIDLEKLLQERMRYTSFADSQQVFAKEIPAARKIYFDFPDSLKPYKLEYPIERFPFVPSSSQALSERCHEAYEIQVQGLWKRLKTAGIEKIVIGVSGGLDSTQALIVAAKTMDLLDLPRTNILAYTMPGFATSRTTHDNALALMQSMGVTCGEIDIKASCLQMFKDIGHPFAEGKSVYDVTFENVQAGERTSHLFRLANFHNAMVLGTGDLSELALGWCTYGVGDHMSHYNVNSSVPKTLIQHLIRWATNTDQLGKEVSQVLRKVLSTEISPELIPSEKDADEKPAQRTEEVIGPYELQDFNLFYVTRYGFSPRKIAFLAHNAWSDLQTGIWPEMILDTEKNRYSLMEIKKWLRIFLGRFFGNTQFKRTCVPNGPKVGSGGSLSPRGDWRAPSDAVADIWLEELDSMIPDEEPEK